MEKRIARRLLSAVLAVCMIVGILPTQLLHSTAQADGAVSYVYNLAKMRYSGDRGYPITDAASMEKMTAGFPGELNPNTPSTPWMYSGMSDGTSFAYISSAYAFMLRGDVGDYVSLDIKVPEAGVYTPFTNCGYWVYGAKV
ncbi:MAG: hypothetical protein RSC43_02480, partial [Clostridia bacterium]